MAQRNSQSNKAGQIDDRKKKAAARRLFNLHAAAFAILFVSLDRTKFESFRQTSLYQQFINVFAA